MVAVNPTFKSPQPPKQVGIWIRVSTEDQAQGDSPAHHEQRAREYAKFNGWEVREVYDLAGVSGKTVMEHPEAKRMLADIKRGHISALIFSKLARLARNTKELLDFSDMFRACGADMVSLQEKIDTSTPAGRLFYTMIAAMAQWEREEIGDRVRASIGIRAKLGKPLNASAPFGFQWKDKKFVQNPAEAPIVKRVFELFAELHRKGAVARQLNTAGYRTRQGSQWADTQIARVLAETAAKGTYYYGRTRKIGAWRNEDKPEEQWVKITVEPIVSDELWHQAGLILGQQEKKTSRPGRAPVRLFGGLTFCHCGHRMYVPSGSRKYACTKCKNKILSDDLDAIFHEEMKAYFDAPERIMAAFETARQNVADKESRLNSHRLEVQKVRDEMNRTHRLYLDGQIPHDSFGSFHQPQVERLRQLQDELPRIEAELDHIKVQDISADQVLREVRALYARWPEMQVEEKRRIVQSLLERITIGPNEIDIKFSHLPSSEELTNSQQCLRPPSASNHTSTPPLRSASQMRRAASASCDA
ncbi:MAG: recombinase family protein [Verrucomicrobia bacterium]|nr:recombinase family protein [Verrucomicrobiota bacterium]